MESRGVVSRVSGWARLAAWAIGLGLATSWLIAYTDRDYAGFMIGAASAILIWRVAVTMGLPELTSDAPESAPAVHQPV